jgi:hypothetical protein
MIRFALLFLIAASCGFAQSPITPAAGKFPALMVQVTVGTQQRPEKGSFYRKTMTVSPKVTIDGPSRMLPIPAMEATMVIVTMDTRAKYVGNDESYKVHSTETIPIPAAQTGDRRPFSFMESSMTYDSYRDNSNAGGEVYKYYVFGLRDPATKTLVDFKTNNPPLATFIKAHPEKRDELLGLSKGAKFPAVFK